VYRCCSHHHLLFALQYIGIVFTKLISKLCTSTGQMQCKFTHRKRFSNQCVTLCHVEHYSTEHGLLEVSLALLLWAVHLFAMPFWCTAPFFLSYVFYTDQKVARVLCHFAFHLDANGFRITNQQAWCFVYPMSIGRSFLLTMLAHLTPWKIK
jgi:hypothetical protein